MSVCFRYDEAYDPPAPVAAVRLSAPGDEAAVMVAGILDTGADCTLIPADLARALALPVVDRVDVLGVAGGRGRAPVCAGRVELAGVSMLARLVTFENEVIIGRDVLNRLVAHLDGPRRQLRLRSR